jgi:hypothetical protein
MIRRIGRRRNEGPSATIRRLAEKEIQQTGAVSQQEYERRMKLWDELMAMVPEFSEDEKQQMQYEMDHMYDYLDEDADKDSQAAE